MEKNQTENLNIGDFFFNERLSMVVKCNLSLYMYIHKKCSWKDSQHGRIVDMLKNGGCVFYRYPNTVYCSKTIGGYIKDWKILNLKENE